ncbi:GntR family transcriptional regulator [Mycolicibacterium sp. S2-37]|uniref:GntR family transcriptional regulator n=1 Tax=Mycolicibacterium sp. S2-37 TaxID=2810297 RepID=UPI001A9452D2|nr:GntR family transcriptional regulator [Mycolicibacterium sp. S2-37]MBO0677596.1 GntR family transcriptional regulator [Mycolicibacterium sp. S2-37]
MAAKRLDAAGRAYQLLSERIAAGEIAPGARLKESALAESLGFSRTPVREALRRLAADGLVVVSPNRGAQVVSYTAEEIDAFFSVRVILEPQAAALAVPRFRADEIDELENLAADMAALVAATPDMHLLGSLNREFHDRFLHGSGNRALSSAVEAVVRPAVVYRTFHRYSPEQLRRSMAHHLELVAAVRARNAEWAESVMRTHLLAARHAATDGSRVEGR